MLWSGRKLPGADTVAEKSSRIADKKTGVRDTFEPPFRPHLTDRTQNFMNVVSPLPVHVYRLSSGSAVVCRTGGLIPEKVQKREHNIGFQCTT